MFGIIVPYCCLVQLAIGFTNVCSLGARASGRQKIDAAHLRGIVDGS